MELVVLLFLLIFIGGKELSNQTKAHDAQKEIEKSSRRRQEIAEKYGDDTLENQLRHAVYDQDTRDRLWVIVSSVLGPLDQWQNFTRDNFDQTYLTSNAEYRYRYEQLTVDILMVISGKLSKHMIDRWFGWNTLPSKRIVENNARDYTLARWVATKMYRVDPKMILNVDNINPRVFFWDGTATKTIAPSQVPTYQ